MKFIFEFNWKVMMFGVALYSDIKCIELIIGPFIFALWWGV